MIVKVWNDNVHPFKQVHNGVALHIPAKSFIEMEYYEAKDFAGTYSPMILDHNDQPSPLGFKMIRIEEPKKVEDRPVVGFSCQACGKTYESERILEVHIDENHLDSLSDPEIAEKRRGRPKKEA